MQHTQVLVSIITPVYNGGAYISKCIESVQEQQVNSYEHIILDGMSTDNTATIVEEYQIKDSHIRLLIEKDNGVYDAMNKGIKLAKGKWLYFLGADDYLYSPRVLKAVIEKLEQGFADIVYGNAWYEKIGRLYDGKFTTEKLLKRNICHQAIFYKADLFAKLGNYSLQYKKEADYDINLRFWLHGASFAYTPCPVAFFSSGGISNDERDKSMVESFPFITTGYLIKGKRTVWEKMAIQAVIFRKTALRYSISTLWKLLTAKGGIGIKIGALLWLLISFPFYLLISTIFDRK